MGVECHLHTAERFGILYAQLGQRDISSSGKCLTHERVKQFPCTVHTGHQLEFRSGSGHRGNVSCFPKDHTFESLLTEIHEATFAEALPRQDAGPELAQNVTFGALLWASMNICLLDGVQSTSDP